MSNRKAARPKTITGSKAKPPGRTILAKRRFVLPSAKKKSPPPASEPRANGHTKATLKLHDNKASLKHQESKTAAPGQAPAAPVLINNTTSSGIDLTETIKTLLHLAQENGYITYDDINDVLPDGLSPEDLDELFTKLRTVDVEIIDQAEVERTGKPEQQEEELAVAF